MSSMGQPVSTESRESTSQEPYNHFSLLRTIEDLFGLEHIGYAGAAEAQSFDPSLFVAKSSR
jgi:hypothetical protein